ncbi:hypothetical protein [Inediibacterium massiliense]|nr:hypothetical protein [Inediibacterium massiliense]
MSRITKEEAEVHSKSYYSSSNFNSHSNKCSKVSNRKAGAATPAFLFCF